MFSGGVRGVLLYVLESMGLYIGEVWGYYCKFVFDEEEREIFFGGIIVNKGLCFCK